MLAAVANPDGEKTFSAAICMIIQNERDIAPWKKTAPLSTQDLNSYVSVKFVTRIHGVPVAGVNLMPGKINQLRSQIFTSSHI
jgi:hypothetical protein